MAMAMSVEERLGHIEERQKTANEKIDLIQGNLSKRIDEGNQRLGTLDGKIENLANRMDSKFDTLINRTDSKFDALINRMDTGFDAGTKRMDSLNSRMTGIGVVMFIAVIGAAASNIFLGQAAPYGIAPQF